jgi:chorismate synthase
MLRFLTAGESHGKGLVVILEGMPAGLHIDLDAVNEQLKRRQGGYGRGRRMVIESDKAEVLSGVRAGETIGSPISFLIRNKDWENWQQTMHAEDEAPAGATGAIRPVVTRPRPGHADLAGVIKYDRTDIRDVLERASARETAARVAAGAIARQLLRLFDVEIVSHVYRVNGIGLDSPLRVTFESARDIGSDSALRCADLHAEVNMIAEIDRCRDAGDTAGGAFEVIARGLPVGLGSYVHWDRKLDGRLAHAMMSIPAIKGVGIGIGPNAASVPGSQMHDEIVPAPSRTKPPIGVARPTNNAGGLEGGVTNGEDLRVSGFMKPIATLMKPLRSVDLAGMQEAPAVIERSDVCAISAAAVVGEAVVSLVLADAFLEKFGGDSLGEIRRNYANETDRLQARFTNRGPASPKRKEREGG